MCIVRCIVRRWGAIILPALCDDGCGALAARSQRFSSALGGLRGSAHSCITYIEPFVERECVCVFGVLDVFLVGD